MSHDIGKHVYLQFAMGLCYLHSLTGHLLCKSCYVAEFSTTHMHACTYMYTCFGKINLITLYT